MSLLGAAAALAGLLGLLLLVPLVQAPLEGELEPGAVPAAYVAHIRGAAASCTGVSAPALAAQLERESGWRPDARSSAGAIGLAQFLPTTWATYGMDGDQDGMADPLDPVDAIWSAARYDCALRQQVATVPGDALELTLAAYNAGPYPVLRYQGVPPYPETQQYLSAILQALPRFTRVLTGAADGLTPRAARVRDLVTQTFGVSDIGGFATEGHVPGSDHYTGRAIDIMLTPRSPAMTALGWRIAVYVQSNAAALDVIYIIWDAQIWSTARAAEGWRPYHHPSGLSDPTLDHLDHVHVSVA